MNLLKKLIILFLTTVPFYSEGQNLVQNPGFEINAGFPVATGQWVLANNWSNANSPTASPDYLHTNGSGNAQLPNSVFGTVSPYQGNAIMGMAMWYSPSPNFREYMSQTLAAPLVVGGSYTFSFYITNGIPGLYGGAGTENVEVDFSVNPFIQSGSTPFNYTPLLTNSTMIYSSTWIQMSYTFVATAPYTHFAIGNFRTDANSVIQQFVSTPNPGAYFFIDEVSLTLDASTINITGDAQICLGDTAQLLAMNSSVFAWADSLNPNVIIDTDSMLAVSPLTTTTYFLYGNNDTVSFTVNVINPPVVNLGNDTSLCAGETLVLNSTTSNATYQWQDSSSNPTYTVTQQGIYWVNVTVNNCSATDSLNVSFNPAPLVNLGNDTTLCIGETLTLNSTTANATYLWQDNSTNPTYTVSQPGTYWVDVTLNNCSTSDSLNVTYQPAPIVNLGNDTSLCQGETLLLNSTTSNATYQWQDNSSNPTYTVTQQGIYWVNVTVSSCSATDSLVVNYVTAPLVNLGNDTTLCNGETLTLNSTTANATYLWQDNSTNPIYTVSQSGIYWVNVTLNNCSTSDTLNVSFTPAPLVDLGNDTTLCSGEILLLNMTSPGATYQWQDNSQNPTYAVSQQGTYWVSVTVNNCSATDTLNVNYLSAAAVNLGNDTSLCIGETLILSTTTSNATYLWQDNSTNSNYTVTQPGIYWVNVTVSNCSVTDTLNVVSEDCEVILEMPNVFTPNGDGINESFVPIEMKGIQQATLQIYNRWGQQLVETNDLVTGWDGKCNTVDCTSGTYFWIVQYSTITNESKTLKGFLTLIK